MAEGIAAAAPQATAASTRRFWDGNMACAEGAVAAGMRFYAGYPITPSSEITEILSWRLLEENGVFIQMEDEIASIAACIGASLGGLKAMTATSGPGFSLMQENLGLAVMAEVPLVIVDVQRLGPSTGQPTSPAQGDVMQAIWGTHGDHPIVVLAPSSAQECYELVIHAFNVAERYRTPVILLTDEAIAHMREPVDVPPRDGRHVWPRAEPPRNGPYTPFGITGDEMVPALAAFGSGPRYHVTGLYHDVQGFPTLVPREIASWQDRVFAKIDGHLVDILRYELHGPADAAALIVSYGITARSARAASRMAKQPVAVLTLQTLWPFPDDLIESLASRASRIVVAEMNRGQIRREVERACGRRRVVGVHRTDGELIAPAAIMEALS